MIKILWISFFLTIGTVFFSNNLLADTQFERLLDRARAGEVDAFCDVGEAYYYGNGTLKDPFKAKCWIKKAYDAGSIKAKSIWERLSLWEYSGSCPSEFDHQSNAIIVGGDVYFDPLTNMQFVYIGKGCFQMGCDASEYKCGKNRQPAHQVCLDSFWISSHEVTQELWQRIMGNNPSKFRSRKDLPVESISFEEARIFISRLSSTSSARYALPSEAQWAYACQMGQEKEQELQHRNKRFEAPANCADCPEGRRGKTLPVGSFPPNKTGLYDMAGNVAEWCHDVYSKKAYQMHQKRNPVFLGKGASRVVMGGSFINNAQNTGCNNRDKSIPAMKSPYIGLRVIMTYKK